jgi:hypothetical protein
MTTHHNVVRTFPASNVEHDLEGRGSGVSQDD